MRLIRDEALAEEVVMETFFEVWRNAARFEGRSTFATWLMAIARNQALRRLGRRSTVQLDDALASSLADPSEDPEASLHQKELSERLRGCLEALSTKHNEVIDLVYYHGKTVAEVAGILELPEATVKTRMFYARRRLAELARTADLNAWA
jgi:RNA polymerase sigma-70 factor (ECF subfamily)